MNDQRKQRAARAEQMRKERERHDRRQRNFITVAFVVVVIALIGGVGIWYSQNQPESTDESYADAPTKMVEPDNVTDDYGIEFRAEDAGNETAKDAPRVVVYEDFQCPVCQGFEQVSGDYLTELATEGDIVLEYRTIAFLDQASSTEYSSRSANAAMCVLEDTDVDHFHKMHDQLYANQPEEGGDGLPDSKLIEFADEAGAEGAESCIKKRTYDPWFKKATEESSENGVEGTPSVRVNGKDVEGKDGGAIATPDELEKAINAAKK